MDPTPELVTKPDVRFIYATHSPENFENVWSEAGTASVILLEATGQSDKTRKDEEDLINYAAQSDDLNTKKNALWLLENNDGSEDFFTKVVEKVVMEGKSLHFLDESEGGEGKKLMDIGSKAYKDAVSLFCEGRPFDSYQKYTEYILNHSKGIQIRNDVVKGQVQDLISSHLTEWQGKKVVAIQGKEHRETYHSLKNSINDVNISRTFLKPIVQFGLLSEIGSRITYGKDENVEGLIKRSFLSLYALILQKENIDSNLADSVVRKLSNNEIDEYFNQIHQIQDRLSSEDDRKLAGIHTIDQFELIGDDILQTHSAN